MQSADDPETAARAVDLAGVSHRPGASGRRTVTSRLLLEAGFSSNLEYYTNELPGGHREAARHRRRGSPTRRASSSILAAARPRRPSQTHAEPGALQHAGVGVVRDRLAQHQGRLPVHVGHVLRTRVDANADLTQQYRSNTTGVPFSVPDTRASSATRRCDYGERLNYDLGIYAQDSWTMKRLTINAGIRWENAERAGAGRRVAGRPLRAGAALRRDREPAELEATGRRGSARSTTCSATEDRAEVLAEPLQPGAHDRHRRQLQPAAVADGDAAVARRERRRHRPGRARLHRLPGARLRDQLHAAVVELRHRGAERRTATIRAPGTSRARSRFSTSCCRGCR